MHNPYWGKSFFSFFAVFFERFFSWVIGKVSFTDIATDEIQLLVLSLIAISCSLLGTFLVLRKMTMLANSLSHTVLLGIVLACIFVGKKGFSSGLDLHILVIASFLTALLTTFFTESLSRIFRLQEDASIGLVFTSLFALGVILVTLFTRNLHIGSEAVMGNVDALIQSDIQPSLILMIFNGLIIGLFFKEFTLTTFDPGLAKTMGFSRSLFNYLLMILVSATAIGAFRAVGVILVLAFLVGPPLAARLWCNHVKKMLFLSCGIGVVCSFIGVAFSRHMLSVYGIPLSTGGLVVSVIGIVYILLLLLKILCRKTMELNPELN